MKCELVGNYRFVFVGVKQSAWSQTISDGRAWMKILVSGHSEIIPMPQAWLDSVPDGKKTKSPLKRLNENH